MTRVSRVFFNSAIGDLIITGGFDGPSAGVLLPIEFMTTSCPACTQQAPILSELWSRHGVNADFLSISIDPARDQPGILSAYAQQHNMPWTWAIDQRQVMQTYGVTATPTIFLLDKDGIVRNQFVGFRDLQTLENSLLALL